MLDTNLNKENEAETEKEAGKKTSLLANSFTIILAILLLAIISVSSYTPIRDNIVFTEDQTEAYTKSNDFAYTLARLIYYFKETKLNDNNWYEHRYETLESVKYHISDADATFTISNMSNVSGYLLQQEIENSQFYLNVSFDVDGNPALESSLDNSFNQNAFFNGLAIGRNGSNTEYAGLTVTYVIPQDLSSYNDFFIDNIKHFQVFPGYILLILGIGAVFVIVLAIAAFSIPYSAQSRITICRMFNRIYLEFKFLLFIGLAVAILLGIDLFMRNIDGRTNLVEIIYSGNAYFYLIGIPITFMLYLFIFLTIGYIKHIYHTGLKEGFIKNSIGGRAAFYIANKLKALLQEAMALDLEKDVQKQLIFVLGINLIALWIIAITGFIGFLLAIGYTIYLFKYLLKLITEVKAISDASSRLAEGDFAISLEEGSSIFSPIAKNLNSIKDGFKLAVEEETKSQKLKAELISNVSHDLKTPLTSIISYVDLLKKEDTNQKAQQEYIDILDQKSQRLKILIEDLFEASKASSGNVELHLEEIDVIALLRQTLGEMEEKINQSTLKIKSNLPEDKIICTLDGKKTYRVFENIMSNILKYAMPNTRVYIDAEEGDEEVSFTFKNISAYEMDFEASEITERFTRGDKSRNTDGSGLGLAIAKSLLELQNGHLEISIDGDLFKLTVKLPKA